MGNDLILMSISPFNEFLRIKAFDENVHPSDQFFRGDANGDLKVALADAVFILNHLFKGGDSPKCRDAADVNDDGRLNLSDALYVLNYLFRGGNPPFLPFSELGTDPTSDDLLCEG